MSKPKRTELLKKVVRLSMLPPGKSTSGYLSREQLAQLIVYLEHSKEQIELLNKKVQTYAESGT